MHCPHSNVRVAKLGKAVDSALIQDELKPLVYDLLLELDGHVGRCLLPKKHLVPLILPASTHLRGAGESEVRRHALYINNKLAAACMHALRHARKSARQAQHLAECLLKPGRMLIKASGWDY